MTNLLRLSIALFILSSLASAQSSVGCGSNCVSGSFTIGLSPSNGGPPTYSRSTRSTANPGTISSIFIAMSPTATTCSGMCQNSTAYDTTVNPSGINCYSRITDGAHFHSGMSAIGTPSGGANDRPWSANEDFLGVADTGGQVEIFQGGPDANGCWKVTGPSGVPPIRVTAGPFAFDQRAANDNVFYAASGSQILQYTIADINTMPTPTLVFDFNPTGHNACPGIPNSAFGSLRGIMVPAITLSGSLRFAEMVQSGPQNTAIWTVFWDSTLGCHTVNWQTGQVWNWSSISCPGNTCSTSTPPLGTFGTTGDICWGPNPTPTAGGIHDGKLSYYGDYYGVTPNGTWTQGACAGKTNNDQHIEYQVATLNNTWGDSENNSTYGNFVSHQSEAATVLFSPQANGANVRPLANAAAGFTVFGQARNTTDIHQGIAYDCGLGPDSCPWIGTMNRAGPTAGSPCANSPLCPTWPNNLIVGQITTARSPSLSPWILFGHTFACPDSTNGALYGQCPLGIADYFGGGQAIGAPSPKGNYWCYATSMLQSLGTDNAGKPRVDEFCVHLQ